MAKKTNNDYSIKFINGQGSLENNKMFNHMIDLQDVKSDNVKNYIGKSITVTGIASCEVKTKDKKFDLNYFLTKEFGLISTSSENFYENITDYFNYEDFGNTYVISSISTERGDMLKANPIF